jgi:MFS superfamily sulfate permease-like transporter
MKFTTKRILWVVFVVIVLCFHLLVGTLLAIATAFYWLLDRRLPPAPNTGVRLSDTAETQGAFRTAVSKVLVESGMDIPLPEGVVDGGKFCEVIRELEESPLFENIKPELMQQLLSFGTLLEACSRLGIEQPGLQGLVVNLFAAKVPSNQEEADTMKQLVAGFVTSIS